jgi:formate-dependent nitrite reductase membrane component NrfD
MWKEFFFLMSFAVTIAIGCTASIYLMVQYSLREFWILIFAFIITGIAFIIGKLFKAY